MCEKRSLELEDFVSCSFVLFRASTFYEFPVLVIIVTVLA